MAVSFYLRCCALIATALLLSATATGCSGGSSAPPPAPASAQSQNDSGTSSLGTGSAADSSSIFGGASSDTAQSVRSEQVTELKAEVSRYENQLEYALSDRDNMLANTLPNVQTHIIPSADTPTILGGLISTVGDVGETELDESTATANGGTSSAGDSSAFDSLGKGISAAQQTAAIQADTSQITSSVQASINQLNSEIKDLQAKIASLEQQIDTLIAQGT